jgi:hypothetical protein
MVFFVCLKPPADGQHQIPAAVPVAAIRHVEMQQSRQEGGSMVKKRSRLLLPFQLACPISQCIPGVLPMQHEAPAHTIKC